MIFGSPETCNRCKGNNQGVCLEWRLCNDRLCWNTSAESKVHLHPLPNEPASSVVYCLHYKITDWIKSSNILIICVLGWVSGGFYGNLCGPTFNHMDTEVEKLLSPSYIFHIS